MSPPKESPIDMVLNQWISRHTLERQVDNDLKKRLAASGALSVKDWHAKPERERINYTIDLLNKVAADHPQRQAVDDYFDGVGSKVLVMSLYLLANLADKGAVDLSKISVGSIVGWIVDMEFGAPR